MSIKLNSSGGGSVTLQEPATASALTLSLPAQTATLVSTGDTGTVSTTMLANAAVTPDKLSGGQSGSAPAYAARAWVNFNGSTSPGTIAASGNVSSVTKIGTGDYQVNFTTAMPDANYVVVGLAMDSVTDGSLDRLFVQTRTQATTYFRMNTIGEGGRALDGIRVLLAVFR